MFTACCCLFNKLYRSNILLYFLQDMWSEIFIYSEIIHILSRYILIIILLLLLLHFPVRALTSVMQVHIKKDGKTQCSRITIAELSEDRDIHSFIVSAISIYSRI
jgi:hypothetical protein